MLSSGARTDAGRRFEVRPPLLARLTAAAGPARSRLIERGGARVLVVPGRYCVGYLLIGADGAVAVDVGSAADIETIARGLRWLGLGLAALRLVVPTHLHFDHVMGVDALALRAGCPVGLGEVAHRHVRREEPTRFPGPLRSCRALFTWPLQGLPFLTLDDWRNGLDFGVPWGRNRFRAPLAPPLEDGAPLPGLPGWSVLALPGHADDGIGLYHREGRLLIAGDVIRNFYGGEWNPLQVDAGDFSRSRERLGELEVECVLPGHGPVLEGEAILDRIRDYPCYVP